jgi:hypothetical protein
MKFQLKKGSGGAAVAASEGKPTIEIRGLDKNPVTGAIDYDLNCCNKALTESPGASDPG